MAKSITASFSAAILLCTAAGGVRAADEPLTGNEIYSHALRAWTAQPEMPYVAYESRRRYCGTDVSARSERVLVRVRSGGDHPKRNADHHRAAALRSLGRVVTQINRYKITLLGEVTYRGHDVYHLALAPFFDPKQNQVRAMWVDTKTFATWRMTVEAPYAVGPARGTFILDAEFEPVAGAMLLDVVTTSGALRFGFMAVGGDARVRFANISLPAAPPAYCFNRAGFNAHESEGKLPASLKSSVKILRTPVLCFVDAS